MVFKDVYRILSIYMGKNYNKPVFFTINYNKHIYF